MRDPSSDTPHYAEVAIDVPLRQTFTYRIPKNLAERAVPGCRVSIPFGPRKTVGVLVATSTATNLTSGTIKTIQAVLDEDLPTFTPELIKIVRWIADYYRCGIGEVIAAAYPFPVSMHSKNIRLIGLPIGIGIETLIEKATSKQQKAVLEFLKQNDADIGTRHLASATGVSESVIRGMIRRELLTVSETTKIRRPNALHAEADQAPALTAEQEQALNTIVHSMNNKGVPVLLEGITGSGKTEVYLQAIREVLDRGKRALVLLPEISLTPQTARRFVARFGDVVAVLHSGLSVGERFDEWWAVRRGERSVVVGARSAVFAPLSDLGLVVVDEEHDHSYKQSDAVPRYHARDAAIVLARQVGAVAVLGSATPSLESAYNAERGKYDCTYLRSRPTSQHLPTVRLVDMRHRPKDEQIISIELRTALEERLANKQQSILFLNRRGFATSMGCNECGHVLRCPNCSVSMVYHRRDRQLICHHCEHSEPEPSVCPECNARFIRQQGWGTERIVEMLQEDLPGAHIVRMDRDTTQRKDGHQLVLDEFRSGADTLVGTQMVTKGLDIPNVTLVGILNADGSLNVADFRASERTFAQLVQVAGRAGRGTEAGEVIVQTWCPDHYAIQLALKQDYRSLYDREIRLRRNFSFPPFTRLILLRAEGENEVRVKDLAWQLYRLLSERAKGVTVLPPLEAPLYRIRNMYRWHIALRARGHKSLAQLLDDSDVDALLTRPGHKLRVAVDVDPTDTL